MNDLNVTGSFLKGRREYMNLTLDYISSQSGLSVDELRRFESDDLDISDSNLKTLCLCYNYDLDKSVSEKPDEPKIRTRTTDQPEEEDIREINMFNIFLHNYPRGE